MTLYEREDEISNARNKLKFLPLDNTARECMDKITEYMLQWEPKANELTTKEGLVDFIKKSRCVMSYCQEISNTSAFALIMRDIGQKIKDRRTAEILANTVPLLDHKCVKNGFDRNVAEAAAENGGRK